MMIRRDYIISLCVLLAISLEFTGCKVPNHGTDYTPIGGFRQETTFVDTIILTKSAFYEEIWSNGVLSASRKANLSFGCKGILDRVNVRNGSRVRKGDIIASLDTDDIEQKIAIAQNSLEKAKLDYLDNLLNFGYGEDTTAIPLEMIETARIRSGYTIAQINLSSARRDYDNSILRAPFTGLIANLNANPFQLAQEDICTLIDDSSFDVLFYILESELPLMSIGQTVDVSSFVIPNTNFSGIVKEINPTVNSKGQISVKASIAGCKQLLDGMNVKVSLRCPVGDYHSVPNSAIVGRDGYDVIFVLDSTNMTANWKYVDVLFSNSTHSAIVGSVAKGSAVNNGDIVIVSGNTNLADGNSVELRR